MLEPDDLKPLAAPRRTIRHGHLPAPTALPKQLDLILRWGKGSPRIDTDPAVGAAYVFTAGQRFLLLVAFVLLLILRLPHAWLHGRFFSEDGSIFMAYAWHRPAGVALWRSFAGYLNLGANATTLSMVKLVRAGLIPLELAPYFTMTIALLFQTIPGVLILTARGRWLANRWSVISCLLIMAAGQMTEEVFANAMHIQFYLALAAGLILALDTPVSRAGRISYYALLLLAPLCGPGAIIILPIFALRALVDRDRARLTQTIVLCIGAALQILLFYHPTPLRGHLFDPTTLMNVMFVRLVVLPYLAFPSAGVLGFLTYANFLKGGIGWWCVTIVSLMYFGWLVGVALRGGRDAALWLILAGLTIAAASFELGMMAPGLIGWFNPIHAERYNYLPLALLGMGLVGLAMRKSGSYRYVCAALCVLTLVSSAETFFYPLDNAWQGPDWRVEVTAWRRNHEHKLAIWPTGWWVDLSDEDRPCSSPGAPNAAVSDATYCESKWSALARHDFDPQFAHDLH